MDPFAEVAARCTGLAETAAARIRKWFSSIAPPMQRDQRIALADDLVEGSQPNLEFLGLMSASAMLAAFGLMQDSAAVIIGAMLIAPLMTPIMGAGLSLTHGNRPLFKTSWLTIGIGFLIVVSGSILWLGRRTGKFGDTEFGDAFGRWKSWTWLSVCILVPVLLGAAWTIAAVTLLSLGCYREFARATGLFRQRLISVAVVVGILILNFAVLDHYERLFFSMAPLTVALIAIITISLDQPRGYVQRVALGTLGFLMFGFSLAYVGNIANSPDYRPLLLLMLLGIEYSQLSVFLSSILEDLREGYI